MLFVPAIEIGPAVYLSRVDRVIGYAWESPATVARQLGSEIGRLAARAAPRVGVSLWSGSLRPGLLAAVKTICDGCAFTHSATCARAASIAARASRPARCNEEALPWRSVSHGRIASNASGCIGVVALWSK